MWLRQIKDMHKQQNSQPSALTRSQLTAIYENTQQQQYMKMKIHSQVLIICGMCCP